MMYYINVRFQDKHKKHMFENCIFELVEPIYDSTISNCILLMIYYYYQKQQMDYKYPFRNFMNIVLNGNFQLMQKSLKL